MSEYINYILKTSRLFQEEKKTKAFSRAIADKRNVNPFIKSNVDMINLLFKFKNREFQQLFLSIKKFLCQ